MSYTPLDNGFLTSTLLQEGPDVVAVWALVLASANKLGESDIRPSIAASLLRITDDRAAAAFEVLSSPDAKSRHKEHEGRRLLPLEDGRWFIVSHQKYQWLASRAAATERQRRYEARLKERDQHGQRQRDRCDEPGCPRPAETLVAGRQVCTAHAFSDPSREPGQEG